MESTAVKSASFSSYQKFVIAVLAFLQFTVILDFMIMSPLGALMMPALNMNAAQFGIVFSVYAFSSGISAFLAAGFADRFDRKKLLLFFYSGFVIGTLFCGLANTFHFLLFARLVTGLFGGVVGSIVFAIATDLFEFQLRGRVMGYLQTAFAASQILGIPLGLYISNMWGWHASFLMIVAVSVVVGLAIWKYLSPIDDHLKLPSDKSPFGHLHKTITNVSYLRAFAATALLSIGGFMLMPFGSVFTVNNLGIQNDKLPLIYLITGICSIFMGPIIGKASDKFGKYKTFVFGTIVSIVMVVIYTNLGVTPLAIVILVNTLMFVGIFSRMIPSQALMSAIPSADSRGSFMSINSSLQQIAGGFASVVAGLIIIQGADGKLQHFDTIGYIMIGTALITMFLMYFINKDLSETGKK